MLYNLVTKKGQTDTMRTNTETVELIKSLCAENNLSLSELARRTGTTKSSLSLYFNSKRVFPLHKINDFASALNVPPEYLLGFCQDNHKGIYDIRELAKKARPLDGEPLSEKDYLAIQNIILAYFKGEL